jgi:hypothetical protein
MIGGRHGASIAIGALPDRADPDPAPDWLSDVWQPDFWQPTSSPAPTITTV